MQMPRHCPTRLPRSLHANHLSVLYNKLPKGPIKSKQNIEIVGCSKKRKMPGLTIGDTLPNLEIETTHGNMKLHDYVADSFTIIFSHPGIYIMLCLQFSQVWRPMRENFIYLQCLFDAEVWCAGALFLLLNWCR